MNASTMRYDSNLSDGSAPRTAPRTPPLVAPHPACRGVTHLLSRWRGRECRSEQRAYTLIELVLVIGIIGLAGALVIPHLVNRENLHTQAAVRRAIGDLSYAQSDALARQEYRRVHFYEDGRGYCILRVNDENYNEPFDPDSADYIRDPLSPAGSGGLYIVDYSTDLRFHEMKIEDVDIDGGGRDIVYDILGGTVGPAGGPGSGGSFIIRSSDVRYRVDVAPFTGKLSVTRLN